MSAKLPRVSGIRKAPASSRLAVDIDPTLPEFDEARAAAETAAGNWLSGDTRGGFIRLRTPPGSNIGGGAERESLARVKEQCREAAIVAVLKARDPYYRPPREIAEEEAAVRVAERERRSRLADWLRSTAPEGVLRHVERAMEGKDPPELAGPTCKARQETIDRALWEAHLIDDGRIDLGFQDGEWEAYLRTLRAESAGYWHGLTGRLFERLYGDALGSPEWKSYVEAERRRHGIPENLGDSSLEGVFEIARRSGLATGEEGAP